jgi:hypothetical protein
MSGTPSIDDLIQKMNAEIESDPHEYPDEGVLYHYTDVAGLIGILNDGAIWATDFRQLNDREELRGEIVAMEEFASIARGKRIGDSDGAAHKFLQEVAGTLKGRLLSSIVHVFMASFSAEGDLLSQWRGYAKHGYAIGINMKAAPLLRQPEPGARGGADLVRCVYDESEFRERARASIRRIDEITRRYVSLRRRPEEKARLYKNGKVSLLAELGTLAPRLKHPGFAEEKEYRLVAVLPRHKPKADVLQFRGSPSGAVVPYVQVPLGKDKRLPLVSLRLGPAHDTERSERGARTLLDCRGYDTIPIKPSSIPFRA